MPPTITHHAPSRTMQARLEDGRIYHVPNVTKKEYAKLMNAPDLGGAINVMVMRKGGVAMPKGNAE